MPELPEVETIRSQLEEYFPLKILSVQESQFYASFFKDMDLYHFSRGDLVAAGKRHGKKLFFEIREKGFFYSHLGMSGGWVISKERSKAKHTHLELETEGPHGDIWFLSYIDPRRFGRMGFYSSAEFQDAYAEWAPDISDKKFDIDYLESVFARFPRKKIKPFLLDQKFFPGVGNYIASEICAHGGVHPEELVGELSRGDYEKILQGVRIVLNDTLSSGGTTFSGGYQDAKGDKGGGVQHLVVFYQKVCQLCGITPVIKTQLAGRGTFHCPSCQRKKG